MIVRLIVPFLCFYASILIAGKSDGPSPKILKKAGSNPEELIKNPQLIPDNNNASSPKDLEKDKALVEDTDISGHKADKEEETAVATSSFKDIANKTPFFNTQLFKALFAKKLDNYDKNSASVLHFSLNHKEDCLTITTQRHIFVYSALTGEQKHVISFDTALPIVRTKFISDDVLMLLTTGKTYYKEKKPCRNKIYSYINVNTKKENKKPGEWIELSNEASKKANNLWASVSVHSLKTKEYDTNTLDIVISQQLTASNLDYQEPTSQLIGDTKIIKGVQRCVAIEQDPSFEVVLYDLQKYYKSPQYITHDESSSDSSQPPIYTELQELTPEGTSLKDSL